jgi:hypothetical protein
MASAEVVFELARPDISTRRALSQLERAVERAISSVRHGTAVLVVDGEQIEVPEAMLQVLLRTVHEQAAGRRVRVIESGGRVLGDFPAVAGQAAR